MGRGARREAEEQAQRDAEAARRRAEEAEKARREAEEEKAQRAAISDAEREKARREAERAQHETCPRGTNARKQGPVCGPGGSRELLVGCFCEDSTEYTR